MKEERYHIALDRYERNITLKALNTLRTKQLQDKRPTEPVDELIYKMANAPTKKAKVLPQRVPEKLSDFLGKGGVTERACFSQSGGKQAKQSSYRRSEER